MLDLSPYKLPLRDAPAAVLAGCRQGVLAAPVPARTEARWILGGGEPPANAVCRDRDGRVLITCVTDMPGVSPAMIDWWFGWHMPATERYALWHPKAHMKSRVKEDRTHWPDIRSRYIGNESYVDEYIGCSLKKLTIAFVPPETFGIHELEAQQATAVCAVTSDRVMGGEGGCLIHYVVPTATGAQMRSGFFLGEVRHQFALVDRALSGVLNTRLLRKALVSDRMALDLLLHCGEEMNHLARFLPRLYADALANGEV